MQDTSKGITRLARANPIPYPAIGAWGLWFVAGSLTYSNYLDREYARLWPSLVFWGMMVIAPFAYYKYRDETFVAVVALVLLAAAMLLGG